MKKFLILIIFSLFISYSFSQQTKTKLDKVKMLINNEFKENMNDYNSYSPVSYSEVDSLFTSIWDDRDFIERTVEPTMKYMNELNKIFTNKINITYDAKPVLKLIKENPSNNYDDNSIYNLEMFNDYQAIMYSRIKAFNPEFIGWKIIHKFRAKNAYNATVLYQYEFKFDPELTKVTEYKSIED